MSDKPLNIVKIDDLAANLRSTMARAGDVFPPTLRRQLSLIVSSFLRTKLTGVGFIHPGMGKMAQWAKCSERQARLNFSRLRSWGVVEIVAFPKGGRRASRFLVNFRAVRMLLVEMGANPSPALCDKLREHENPEVNPEVNPEADGAENPEVFPASTSAGIQSSKGVPDPEEDPEPQSRLKIVGGRDA